MSKKNQPLQPLVFMELNITDKEKFNEFMSGEYQARDITNASQLSKATGISKPTCKELFHDPSRSKWPKFKRACEKLGISLDSLHEAAAGLSPDERIAYDAEYEHGRALLDTLAHHILKLTREQQDTILQMVCAVTPSEGSNKLHRAACDAIAGQLNRLSLPHILYDGDPAAHWRNE